MRLHPQLISFLAESVINDLRRARLISASDIRGLTGLVVHVIEEDLEREAALDEEVREILDQHYEEMRRGGLSYDDMFRKVKSKLAGERGIVL